MSGAVVLRLDTHAPVVTWGGTGGTSAGELFRIGYTLDEPDALAGRLILSDRTLTLAVLADHLQVLLPPDAPAGMATVELDVEDDVGNAATRTTVVLLGGTAAPYDPPTAAGLPRRTARARPPTAPTRERKTTRSRVAARASSSSRARLVSPAQLATRSSTYVTARAGSAEVSRLALKPLTTTRTRAWSPSTISVRGRSDRRRRDDPALIALLLVD